MQNGLRAWKCKIWKYRMPNGRSFTTNGRYNNNEKSKEKAESKDKIRDKAESGVKIEKTSLLSKWIG